MAGVNKKSKIMIAYYLFFFQDNFIIDLREIYFIHRSISISQVMQNSNQGFTSHTYIVS